MKQLLQRTVGRGGVAAFVSIGLLLGTGPAGAVVYEYCANLDGLQEVPPNPSPGTGYGTFTIDTDANTVSFNITFAGLIAPETAAHIHGYCPPGVACGVIFPLPLGSPKIGVWNYPETSEADILAGLTYVNVHSSQFPGGEIRGQILECPVTPTDEASWGRVKTLFR
jgi:hypothetical protein